MLAQTMMYLRVTRATRIMHEEHGPIDLPVGDYRVRRQVEYTPEGWRRVAD
jgi:hypothetical protein